MKPRLLASACAVVCLCASIHAAAPPANEPREPLPEGAIARLGYARMIVRRNDSLHVSPDGRWAVCYGECFDLVAGLQKPAPVHVPDGYQLERLLTGGVYVVSGKEGYALFRRGEKPLHFGTDSE